ncbi:MAG: sugar ABC transporter permease, partial [Caldilineaceae bacterium]|nr:sugar ABC transporter permease [Caldilineaceae bacterium]
MADAATLGATSPTQPKKPRWSRKVRSDNIAGYLFLAPWVIGFLAFTVGPMLGSGYLSLTKYSGFGSVKWIGFENYDKIFQDDLFYTSLFNTSYYAFLGVPAQLLVALCLAVLLNMKVRGVNIFRTVYYIPTVTPAVANVFLWVWIFNFDFGLINSLLRVVGITPVNWLWDPQIVKPALILMSLWSVGQQMVIFLAALQGVSEELLEAASIDGANNFRRFLSITIPLISPVIFLNPSSELDWGRQEGHIFVREMERWLLG